MEKELKELLDRWKNNNIQFLVITLEHEHPEEVQGGPHALTTHVNANNDHHLLDMLHHGLETWSHLNHPCKIGS